MCNTIGPIRTRTAQPPPLPPPPQPPRSRRRYRPRHALSSRIRPYVLLIQERGELFVSGFSRLPDFTLFWGGWR
ncbi:hypothetical protein GCM10009834_17590 [Streptomonospora arabica]